MRKLLRILLVQSGKDLFRYKSFFLLIFALILLDRFLKKVVRVDRSALDPDSLKEISFQSAQYVFEELQGVLIGFLSDYRTFLVIAGLFLLKQIIFMWPSSDMRRMHRQERGSFGLIGSLLAIRWQQVLWDGRRHHRWIDRRMDPAPLCHPTTHLAGPPHGVLPPGPAVHDIPVLTHDPGRIFLLIEAGSHFKRQFQG